MYCLLLCEWPYLWIIRVGMGIRYEHAQIMYVQCVYTVAVCG